MAGDLGVGLPIGYVCIVFTVFTVCSSTVVRHPIRKDHTQVRFWTTDVAADVRELADRGVVFDAVETT